MYAALIAEDIGTSDPATVTVVEEFMRTDRSGLDGLARQQFTDLARESYADLAAMRDAGELEFYCQALGLAVPAVA